MSDNGKMLLSMLHDTYGWHDTVCGHTLCEKSMNNMVLLIIKQIAISVTEAVMRIFRLSSFDAVWISGIYLQ